MENVNFIFKCIKNLLEIVVKLKIKKCWPKWLNLFRKKLSQNQYSPIRNKAVLIPKPEISQTTPLFSCRCFSI